ncbi:hypothetical protein BofuT4_P040580.1 [Botrytis cinerea T4]|uniref:Uncharacterized protein n=1 Tax=Botryotinia fuckeliana (strain T4) TaxID=999810 RepID=G2Y1A7_BOTF4|nr:hypothetical protein BofuT4_P040580.1 [Botrytis cinerea T4]
MAPYRYHVSDGIDTCPPYNYSRCVPQSSSQPFARRMTAIFLLVFTESLV